MAYLRTVEEKLATRLQRMNNDHTINHVGNTYRIGNVILLRVTDTELQYGIRRYFPNYAEPLQNDRFSVRILLTHDTIPLINNQPINPPRGARKVFALFNQFEGVDIKEIIIGAQENEFTDISVSVTAEMYRQILEIEKEESRERSARVFNRMVPFLSEQFGIDTSTFEVDRNYGLLLQECIASGEFTQQDLIALISKLEPGSAGTVVIEKQINKQLEWLIQTIEEILNEDSLTKPLAKTYGFEKFGYPKNTVTGPEHLMEKILTDFGQYSLFGVPALLNTNKYVIHDGVSRSQFDLILITHLGDIELVELKRPDDYLLEYGDGRGKFYPSKILSVAIGQLERYITAAYKDNDEEYLIDNMRIRDFINENVGNDIYVESIRPRGLIIMGSWQKLSAPYDSLPAKARKNMTEARYTEDALRAYKELKNALKNISLITYSELLENARTRIKFSA